MASGGIASLGTTTIGNGSTEGPGDGEEAGSGNNLVDGGSNIGDHMTVFCWGFCYFNHGQC